MSQSWITAKLNRLVKLGGEGGEIATDVLKQIRKNNVQAMVVTTKIAESGASNPQFLLKAWNDVGKKVFDSPLQGSMRKCGMSDLGFREVG